MVQAVCNVLIQMVSVPAMLDLKGLNVMLLVVVIPLVQATLHVISLQVNVLATLVILVPHVINVQAPTIIQVAFVKVMKCLFNSMANNVILYLACGCDATGASGTTCDSSTGQCSCNPGFTGTACTCTTTNQQTRQILSDDCSLAELEISNNRYRLNLNYQNNTDCYITLQFLATDNVMLTTEYFNVCYINF